MEDASSKEKISTPEGKISTPEEKINKSEETINTSEEKISKSDEKISKSEEKIYKSEEKVNKSEEDVSMTILVRTSCVERVDFGREPAELVCKNCDTFITTEITRHNGVCAFFTVLVALFLCTPCAWVPLVAPTFKDTLHTCPNCGYAVGVHRYFK